MKPHILIAVLNWGLGHATRSSVIIDGLMAMELSITIASSGLAGEFLRKRYSNLNHEELPNHEVTYSKSGAFQGLIKRAFVQEKINSQEQKWIKEKVVKLGITHIISDNIYGAYSNEIPCALMTHQLNLRSPLANSSIKKRLAKWINNFSEVWIPDNVGVLSLSGEMSSNKFVEIPVKHLGWISRFRNQSIGDPDIDCTVLLSGLEPQRSILEDMALEMARDSAKKIVIVRGSSSPRKYNSGQVEVYDLVTDDDLGILLQRSKHVLCRSGYSSLLDLLVLGKSARVIPTPQQPEQMYLAKRVDDLGWFKKGKQDSFKPEYFEQNEAYQAPRIDLDDKKLDSILRKFIKPSSR